MYLGIDIGTSSVKAVLLESSGGVLGEAAAPLELAHPQPLWSEQNPQDWMVAVYEVCAALRGSHAQAWQRIRAVGLSGQMHGAVCLGADDAPLRAAILWNDGRSFAECDALIAALPDIESRAGVLPMPGLTAPKILWLQQHEADIYRRIRRVLLPKDYVRLRLTGEAATDCSDAAGTLWLDQRRRDWCDRLCAASQTAVEWLPRVYEGTEISGRLSAAAAQKTGLPAGLPVVAGGGDAAAGAVAAGATERGGCFLSLGTSGQLFAADSEYKPPRGDMIHAFAHCLPGRWFHMAAMLNGARPLAWWAEVCGATVADLLAETRAAVPSSVPIFLPYLTGERTPHNDPQIRGAFYGLENATARSAMTQAVVDSVCFSFMDAQAALAHAGTEVADAAVMGGGAQSDALVQQLADCLRISLTRYQNAATGPAVGAAKIAMCGDGITEHPATPPVERIFTPGDGNDKRAEWETYRRLYQTLRPFAREITDRGYR